MKWTQYSSENMREQRADVLIIPTRVEDLIQQIPDRNCVENVFTKDARLGLRRSESSEWGDEEVNVEKGNFDSGFFFLARSRSLLEKNFFEMVLLAALI